MMKDLFKISIEFRLLKLEIKFLNAYFALRLEHVWCVGAHLRVLCTGVHTTLQWMLHCWRKPFALCVKLSLALKNLSPSTRLDRSQVPFFMSSVCPDRDSNLPPASNSGMCSSMVPPVVRGGFSVQVVLGKLQGHRRIAQFSVRKINGAYYCNWLKLHVWLQYRNYSTVKCKPPWLVK